MRDNTTRKPAEVLRRWREAKGWTRKQAAEHLGVSERSIENWEYGHRTPQPLPFLEQLLESRIPVQRKKRVRKRKAPD